MTIPLLWTLRALLSVAVASVSPFQLLLLTMTTPSAIKPKSKAAATDCLVHERRRVGMRAGGDAFEAFASRNSTTLSHRDSAAVASTDILGRAATPRGSVAG